MSSEHLEQAMLVSWFRKNYHPTHRIFSIPNGGARSAMNGMSMKAEGLTKGVPDLCIPSIKLFIELKKVKGGKLSVEQKDWLDYLNSVGYIALECKGFEDAKANIISLMNYLGHQAKPVYTPPIQP